MLGLGTSIIAEPRYRFQPTDISNLALWLKNGAGNTAAQWDDSSGNDNHATQGTTADQATPTRGGLLFDGNDWYDLTTKITNGANENILVGIVFKIRDPFQAANLLSDASNEFFQLNSNKIIKVRAGGVNTILTNDGDDALFDNAAGVQSLVISRNDGATGTWNFYRNNTIMTVLQIDGSTGSFQNQTNPGILDFDLIGANSDDSIGLGGTIYEVVVYELGATALTSQQISDINYYLYNLTKQF
jgi:hypothetical protein